MCENKNPPSSGILYVRKKRKISEIEAEAISLERKNLINFHPPNHFSPSPHKQRNVTKWKK